VYSSRSNLKILLPPHEIKTRLRIHITFDVQLASQHLGSAEEDARFSGAVELADRPEHHVPVRTAEVGGCAETGNGVSVRVDVVDHDVGGVIGFDFRGKVLCVSGLVGKR
jgi:carbon monoxide dehydrogenase subunit G